MRVAVLSNSHAAALKTAYDALDGSQQGSLAVTFFASRQHGLASLRARGGKLVSIKDAVTADLKFTSGGHSALDPDAFDAIIIHALGLDFQYGVFDSFHRSSSFIREWVRTTISRSINLRLGASLRSISRVPIFLSPRPFVSEDDAALRAAVEGSSTPRYDLQELLEGLLPEIIGGSLTWLAQPPETIAQAIFTRREFSNGSMRLRVDASKVEKLHDSADHIHMNTDYGAAFWRQFMERHLQG